MHFSSVALTVAACFIGRSSALPLVVDPGTAANLIITSKDTVNGTTIPQPNNGTTTTSATGASPTIVSGSNVKVDISEGVETVANGQLSLSVTNNLASGSVNAYITGLDVNNQVVLLQPDGTFYYPTTSSGTPVAISASVALPLGGQGSTTSITIPAYISSARIWFADGTLQFFVVATADGHGLVEPSAVNPEDPSAAVNWGFVELTWDDAGVFANISYVDFVGLPLGMSLSSSDGSVQSAPGLVSNAVEKVCNALISQAKSDGQPWDQLCVTTTSGTPVRVLSPNDYVSIESSAFDNYWTSYVSQVWSYYTFNTLTIDTQESYGNVTCQVSGGELQCAGDNRGYSQPVAADIFGCNSGPFSIETSDNDIHCAVVPRLCAAFDRSTLLLSGGDVQPSLPSTDYYIVSPTNWYSAFVHQNEVTGTGYAFAYDDVNPAGENQSGAVSDGSPNVLSITVGGPH